MNNQDIWSLRHTIDRLAMSSLLGNYWLSQAMKPLPQHLRGLGMEREFDLWIARSDVMDAIMLEQYDDHGE